MRRCAVLFVFVLAACYVTDPRLVVKRQPGVIVIYQDTVLVHVPTAATAGTPVEITFITLGRGCTWLGDTEVSTSGLTADVTPYDSVAIQVPKNTVCPANTSPLNHTATLTFPSSGSATVHVHGLAEPGDLPVDVTRTIVVQ